MQVKPVCPALDWLNYMAVTMERQTKHPAGIPISNNSLPATTTMPSQTASHKIAILPKKQEIETLVKKKDKLSSLPADKYG